MRNGAIITADIVNSTLLPRQQLNKVIKSVELLLQPHKHEFFRGDSFQVYIKDSRAALQLGLKLRLAAKRIMTDGGLNTDIRVAIGIGPVKPPVRTLKQSSEEPFVLSGRALDELTGSKDRLRIVSSRAEANDLLRVIGRFTDYIFNDLTTKQSAVIFELLQGNTQTNAAKKLKKSQVTINRQAHAAGWTEINLLVSEYENAITKYLLQ